MKSAHHDQVCVVDEKLHLSGHLRSGSQCRLHDLALPRQDHIMLQLHTNRNDQVNQYQ